MFKSSPILVGLDLGTSKICAAAAEVAEDGALNVVGLGQAKSRGLRKGEIVDAAACSEDIREAIVEVEQMADIEVRSVYLGVTGGHVRGFNNRGFHPIVSQDREISEDDVQDVVKNAKAINLSAETYVLHGIRQHFFVDGQDGIVDPVGRVGSRLEVDIHVVHANANRLQNSIRAVRDLQIEVEGIVFSGLASALTMLNNQQKDLGALVIDLGGGTTEYVVYGDGVIKHTGVLAVGGDHVSNDLAYGLKLPLGRAELLKLEQGSALMDRGVRGRTLEMAGTLGCSARRINLEHLRQIMSLRLEEIFQLVAEEIESIGLLPYLRAGVFLCGGGARIPEITKLAEQVFGLPACVGKACGISGIKTALEQPEFATAIGLARFGSFEQKKRSRAKGSLAAGVRNTLGQLFGRA